MTLEQTSVPSFETLEKLLRKYFPDALSAQQIEEFRVAFEGYVSWNAKINVISRKDMGNLGERHFLHSLAIAKLIQFKPGTKLLDAGTGGGFPGIPLAIFFPESTFHLVDSRRKKIQVVEEIVRSAGLKNVQYSVQRVEDLSSQFDFVLSRAVASLDQFIPWVRRRIHCRNRNDLKNGILYLRGEADEEELRGMGLAHPPAMIPLAKWFEEDYFDTKYLLHLGMC
jgi:16S rRNA (guanine527-N7)-methyltransferase